MDGKLKVLFGLEMTFVVILSILLILSVIDRRQLTSMLDSIQNRNEIVEERMQEYEDLQRFRNYILFTGDTSAYNELIINYYGLDNILYSIYMSDHCNYPYACYNVYDEILRTIDELEDSITINKAIEMAVCYLKKGVSLNDRRCARILAELYIEGSYVPRDTILGRDYLKQAVDSIFVDDDYERIRGQRNGLVSR